MTVSDRIRQRRRDLELSQDELAARAGYTDKTSISKLENAGNDISMKQINRLAKALECSSAYLLGWASNPKSSEADPIIVDAKIPADLLSQIKERANIQISSPDEIEIIEAYRNQSPEIRNAARRVLGLKESGSSGSEESGTA